MKEIDKFEKWIKTRKLITKYNASLKRTSDDNFCDVRINGHWVTWQAALKCKEK
jgi:hypothetical protein